MPGTQEEDGKNAAANQIDDRFNQELIEVLAEESRHRFQCLMDEWNRTHWFSRFRKNPHEKQLNGFNSDYAKTGSGEEVLSLQAQASAIVKAVEKLSDPHDENSFSNSVKAIFQRQGILSVSAGENIADISDPVVKLCLQHDKARQEKASKINRLEVGYGFIDKNIPGYQTLKNKRATEKLYLKAKYPGLLQANVPSLDLPVSTVQESTIGAKDLPENLKNTIKGKISSLYPNGLAQQLPTNEGILKNIPSTWYGFFWESAEKKTVRLILEEVDKDPSSNIDMVAVERRLQRLERQIAQRNSRSQAGSQLVSATDNGDAFEEIRAAFGEIRISSKIKKIANPSPGVPTLDQELDDRVRELEQYKKALDATVEPDAINIANLPADKADLQALVYFVFQHNIKEKAPAGAIPFFPISWTENDGLTINPNGGKYDDLLTIFNQDLLDNTNPEFYFSALMVSMALMSAEQEEQEILKTLLEIIFSGQGLEAMLLSIKDFEKIAWLTDYLPSEPLSKSGEEVIKVKAALESKGMFIAAQAPSQSASSQSASSQSASSQIVIKTHVIPNNHYSELMGHASEISKIVVGESKNFSEKLADTQVEKNFSLLSEKGVNGEVMLLYALILWFIKEAQGTYDAGNRFVQKLTGLYTELNQVLRIGPSEKNDQISTVPVNYLSNKPLALDWTTLANLADNNVSVFTNSGGAAVRFVKQIRSLFPDGSMIFPGGKISGKVISRKTHPDYPKANPYTQAAYDLCLEFRKKYSTEKHTDTTVINMLKRHNQMLSALSFAVTSDAPEFPDLTDVMPKLSSTATGAFKYHLDEIKRIAASARDAYVKPVVKAGSPRDKIVSQKSSGINSPGNSGSTVNHQLTDSSAGLFRESKNWVTEIRDIAMPMMFEMERLNDSKLAGKFVLSNDESGIIKEKINAQCNTPNLQNQTLDQEVKAIFGSEEKKDNKRVLAIGYFLIWYYRTHYVDTLFNHRSDLDVFDHELIPQITKFVLGEKGAKMLENFNDFALSDTLKEKLNACINTATEARHTLGPG